MVLDDDCDGLYTIDVRDLRDERAARRFGDGGTPIAGLDEAVGDHATFVRGLTWATDTLLLHDRYADEGTTVYALSVDDDEPIDQSLQAPEGETWELPLRPTDDVLWVVASTWRSDPDKHVIKVLEIETMDVLGEVDGVNLDRFTSSYAAAAVCTSGSRPTWACAHQRRTRCCARTRSSSRPDQRFASTTFTAVRRSARIWSTDARRPTMAPMSVL